MPTQSKDVSALRHDCLKSAACFEFDESDKSRTATDAKCKISLKMQNGELELKGKSFNK